MGSFHFFLFFIFRTLFGQPCLSFIGVREICLACSSQYYLSDTSISPFPESNCRLKKMEKLFSRVLIMTSSSYCDEECGSKFSFVYHSLNSGLREQSTLASNYIFSEIEIYLSLGEHYILNDEIQGGMYFRGVNASIQLLPLPCDYLSHNPNLCVPKGQKAIIKPKTNIFFIFICRSLEISDIIFNFIEQLSENPNVSCLYLGSNGCCSVNSPDYAQCSLKSRTIDYENRSERDWGMFNAEAFIDGNLGKDIQISINNSEFHNILLVNQTKGFITILSVLWNSRAQITIINCLFSDSFYLKGIINYENSLEDAKKEQWIANIDEEKIEAFILSIDFLRHSLNIIGTDFKNYNLFQIMDNRKLEEKSLLRLDSTTTRIFLLDLKFVNLNAQDPFNQILISILSYSSSSSLGEGLDCVLIQNISVNNSTDFAFLSAKSVSCIILNNFSVILSNFHYSPALIVYYSNFTLSGASFQDLQITTITDFINAQFSTILLQDIVITRSQNPRVYLEFCVINIIKLSMIQVFFKFYLVQIRKTVFTIKLSNFTDISVSEDHQDIVIYQQENSSLFQNVNFQEIKGFSLKFFDKTISSTFLSCQFFKINDLNNFLAAESVYNLYILRNSSIISCAFLNFYFSLNGNRFTVQPKIILEILLWENFTVRVGYFSAFSNVQLEVRGSQFINMIGVKKDNFVRFFYIGRSSSFLMEDSRVIDCGYSFEPVLKEYAYNYLFLLGQFISSFFKIVNSLFQTNQPLSLKTGYVASNRNPGKVSIINCSFHVASNDDLSHNGVTFTTTNEVEFINNTIINIKCPKEKISIVHEWGAVFMYGEETAKFNKNTKIATIVGNYFENCTCRGGGGLNVVNYHQLTIDNNIFKYNSAWYQIGTLGISSSSKVLLRGNIIYGTFAPSFGAIKIESVRSISIENLSVEKVFSNLTAAFFIVDVANIKISSFFNYGIESYSNGGLFYLANANFSSTGSVFTNIKTSMTGGVFLIDRLSNLTLVDNLACYAEALSGGILASFIGKSIFISNLTVRQVISTDNGAAFFFEQIYLVQINNISIVNVTAGHNGVIAFELSDETLELILKNIICIKNEAKSGSCLYIDSNTNITILNIIIKECKGLAVRIFSEIKIWIFINLFLGNQNLGEELLSIENSFLLIDELLLENNFIGKNLINLRKISKGSFKNLSFIAASSFVLKGIQNAINLEDSSVVLQDFNFNFLNAGFPSSALFSRQSKIILMNASIIGSRGLESIGAFSFESSLVEVININFFFNYGICITGIGVGGSFKEVLMIFNKVINVEQPVHFVYKSSETNSSVLILEGVSSIINHGGISMKFTDFGTVVIIKSVFKSNIANNDTSGNLTNQESKGIEAVNILRFIVKDCEFDSFFTGGRGSALFVSDDYKSDNLQSSFLLIGSSSFSFCSSFQGAGAIFVINKKKILIMKNSFINNSAKIKDILDISEFQGVGAVGMILCYQSQREDQNCQATLIDNIFGGNFAFYHSPLFYLNSSSNIIESTYINNADQINFTKMITRYPPDVKILLPLGEIDQKHFHLGSELLVQNMSFLKMENSENTNLFVIRSGEPLNISFFITDSENKILVFDNYSYASLEVAGGFKYQIKIENGVAKAHKGWFKFTNTRIFGWPNSTVRFEFSFKVPKYIIMNPELIKIAKSIFVRFNPCLIGEILLQDLQCSQCQLNTFSTDDPMEEIKRAETQEKLLIPPTRCSPCVNGAFCPGGWAIYPLSGGWRSSNISKHIIDCMIPQACIGYDESMPIYENLIGLCKIGHFGNLCHDCIDGYGKLNENFTCNKCDEILKEAMVRLCLSTLMMLVYVIYGSHLYSIQRERKRGYLFVYLRIGISFSQITSFLTYIKLDWPIHQLNKYQTVSSTSLSLTSEDVLLNDCILKKFFQGNQLFSLKMIMSIFLPLVLFCLSSLIWLIYILVSRRRRNLERITIDDFYKKIIASLIISVTIFHPLIIRNSFKMINCFLLDPTIGNEEFLYANPNFRCWDTHHYKIIFLAVIPGIVVWGVVFQVTLFYLLGKHIECKGIVRTMKFENRKIFPRFVGNNMELEDIGNISSNNQTTSQLKQDEIKTDILSDESPPIIRKKLPTRFESLIIKSYLLRFLYHGYKEDYPYWEFLVFLKKFLLSMLINFNQILGFEFINLLILSMLSLHLYLHITRRPYIVENLNKLEFLCITGSILIFLAVIMIQVNLNAASQYFFASIIFMSYTVCLCYTLFNIILSLLRMDFFKKFRDLGVYYFSKSRKSRAR